MICIGPGWCKTELGRNVYIAWYKKILLAPIALCFMRSSKEGAQNIIQAVLEDQSYFKVSTQYLAIFAPKYVRRAFVSTTPII